MKDGISASELWVAAQRTMPSWARGRMNATVIMMSQGGIALGGIVWGFSSQAAGVNVTLVVAAVAMALSLLLAIPLSINFTTSLSIDPPPIRPVCSRAKNSTIAVPPTSARRASVEGRNKFPQSSFTSRARTAPILLIPLNVLGLPRHFPEVETDLNQPHTKTPKPEEPENADLLAETFKEMAAESKITPTVLGGLSDDDSESEPDGDPADWWKTL